jgi:hypothetical protein
VAKNLFVISLLNFEPLRLSGKKSNRNFFVEFCPLRLSGKNNKNFGK